jgi:hypothetical protein
MKTPEAYWLSPSGKVLYGFYKHIQAVWRSPETFGLTDEYLKEICKKYGDPICEIYEGKARQEIMEGLIRGGWIRIRFRPKNQCYTVELDRLSGERKNYLRLWASSVIREDPGAQYADVNVIELSRDNAASRYTLTDMAAGVLSARDERNF